MAIEISEGAAAAAMLLKTSELKITNNNVKAAMKKVHDIIKDTKKVHMSNVERQQYLDWFDPDTIDKTVKKKNPDARLTAIVHGFSAALAVKKWFLSSQHKESNDKVSNGNVYLTGGSWHPSIKFLQVNVNNWADYNSSDLVIIKGKCYYGVSLKKKAKASAANPPMINKSVIALLKDLGNDKVANKLYNSRVEYFGGIVKKSKTIKVPSSINNKQLFEAKILHPLKTEREWINLIDLKGEGVLNLKSGQTDYQWIKNKPSYITGVKTDSLDAFKKHPKVRALFGYDTKTGSPLKEPQWKFRKEVNTELGVSSKGFYSNILKIMNEKNMPEKIGGYLISAVLKTELKDVTGELLKKGHHFGFALVTALGEVKNGKMNSNSIMSATIKNNPTIQARLADMQKAVDKGSKWRILIDQTETEKVRKAAAKKGNSPPAKLFFVLGIGGHGKTVDHKVLDFQIRYKGSFSPSPQFLGGMTKDFEKALESKDIHLEYNFAKACN
jgi:hypothetical protein